MTHKPYVAKSEDLLGKSCKLSMTDSIVVMCPECYSLFKLRAAGEITVEGGAVDPTDLRLKPVLRGTCACGGNVKFIMLNDLIADAVMMLNKLQYYTEASYCSNADEKEEVLSITFVEKESFADLPEGWTQSDDGKRVFSNCDRVLALNNLYSWLYTLKKCGKEQ